MPATNYTRASVSLGQTGAAAAAAIHTRRSTTARNKNKMKTAHGQCGSKEAHKLWLK